MTVLARRLFDSGIFSVVTNSGSVGVGWQLAFYVAGTATPITTYNAGDSGSANANPIISDANGRFGQIWIDDNQAIKWVLSDNNGVVKDTYDDVGVEAAPVAPDASLTNFLEAVSPLPIANGGTNAESATNACVNIGAVQKAGDTLTGNLTRSGKGCVPFFHDAAMVNPEIFIAATGGSDPRSGLPGQVWLRY